MKGVIAGRLRRHVLWQGMRTWHLGLMTAIARGNAHETGPMNSAKRADSAKDQYNYWFGRFARANVPWYVTLQRSPHLHGQRDCRAPGSAVRI
ncbi:hypothetical protein V5P93_004444 [Actinokineospora auranticolor]|uniref:Uncharacterized protein n=1 Tax=Actinokineospora auranticolor TaxID=155976 RepID=A0A2S6GTD4_9PSEU|nr:hypothetical protein [Actinokineospora auranticolor]PPK68449.1 hypothetical protein CLV40_105172 [Actinokineospora auranticolor]